MNFVEPIRDERDIEKLKEVLKSHNYRDYLLLILAINTGMKISDLLSLKFNDLKETDGFVSSIYINDHEYHINSLVKECCETYHNILSKNNKITDSYIFLSRKGCEAIDRSHAYRILNEAAKQSGLNCKVGPHTLRKTFGYHHYKKFQDIKYLQKLFHHNSSKQTFKYIGMEQSEKVNLKVKELNL